MGFLKNLFRGKQNISGSTITASTVIQAGGDVNVITVKPEDLKQYLALGDTKLLNKLVEEKISGFRDMILYVDKGMLSSSLDELFSNEIKGLAANILNQLRFYRLCQFLLQGDTQLKTLEEACQLIEGELQKEAEWIKEFWQNPSTLTHEEFSKHMPEIQALVLEKMFREKLFDGLIQLYQCDDGSTKAISEQLCFYCGLSSFCMEKYEEAAKLLGGLCGKSNRENYRFFALIAKLEFRNKNYVDKRNEEELIDLLDDLEKLNLTGIYKLNLELVAITQMITCFNISRSNKDYFEKAEQYYRSFSEGIKRNVMVTYFYGMSLELQNKPQKAIEIYLMADWKNNEAIAHRLILSYVQDGKPEVAIEIYHQLQCSGSRVDGVYLSALRKTESTADYANELSEKLKKYDSLEDIFYVALYIENRDIFEKYILEKVETVLVAGDVVNDLDASVKVGYVGLFTTFSLVKYVKWMLDNMDDLSTFGDGEIYSIYRCLYEIIERNRDNSSQMNDAEEIIACDSIIDHFLRSGVHREWFLQLKINCSKIQSKPFSMLKYSKELYDLSPDLDTASNILGMILQQGKTDAAEFEPYISAIRASNEPKYLMNAAVVLQRLGKEEEADYLAYKSLYVLNGKYDFDILGSYCMFHFRDLQKEKIPLRKTKSVVILNVDKAGSNAELMLCIDEEAELNDDENRSLGIRHINRKNKDYLKLVSSGIGQRLVIDGNGYTVKEYIPRSVYAFRYVLRLVQDNQKEFEKRSIWAISGTSAEDMLEQLKALSDNRERTDYLFNLYNFKEGEIGIPLDSFVQGDYSAFIGVIKWLLYSHDLVFYAGAPVIEQELSEKYVITISSLILLGIGGWLSILKPIKDRIICPKSYWQFFNDLYENETKLQQRSPGKLAMLNDGRQVMVENDRSIPEICVQLRDLCQEFEQIDVMDDERITYEFMDGMTGESFFSKLNINTVQLDAFILTERLNATYLCDDLFFRKIATHKGIKNSNVTSLLYNHIAWEEAVSIVKELSRTNYVYTPFIHVSNDDALEIANNLLNGKIKKEIYGEFFNQYSAYAKAYLREMFTYDE